MRKREIVDLEAVLVHQTKDAYLLDFDGEDPIWIPASVADISEPNESGIVIVTLPVAYAQDKELI